MVSAELRYNPYILETKVSFNGHEPKANSRVNQYDRVELQDWLGNLPGIFFDEMNGYDFDLYFSGTEADFSVVGAAFKDAGIFVDDNERKSVAAYQDQTVRLTLKNVIESAKVKLTEVEAFNDWLKSNRNRRFNADIFLARYAAHFKDAFLMFLVGNGGSENLTINNLQVSIQNIQSVDELPADISHTPIVVYIDEEMFSNLTVVISKLFQRTDIKKDQLFVSFGPEVDKERVMHELVDLGIENPATIASLQDNKLKMFVENYSLTAFIRSTIQAYEQSQQQVGELLTQDNQLQELANGASFKQIEEIDAAVQLAKEAEIELTQNDPLIDRGSFTQAGDEFNLALKKWKNRSVKFVTEDEARIGSEEFQQAIRDLFGRFKDRVEVAYQSQAKELLAYKVQQFSRAGFEPTVQGQVALKDSQTDDVTLPDYTEQLLQLKTSESGGPANELIGFVKGFLGEDSSDNPKGTSEYYLLNDWRNYIAGEVDAELGSVQKIATTALEAYGKQLTAAFLAELERYVSELELKKAHIVGDLSVEAKLIQEDNDWLAKFREQLDAIERN